MCFIFLRRLFKKCIYLAALNPSYGMWGLQLVHTNS